MKRFFLLFAALMLVMTVVLASAAPARAEGAITVTTNRFVNNFRQNLQFQLEAQSSAKITQVALIVQITGVSATTRQVPDFTPDNQIKAVYEWRLTTNYVPPGTMGQYWWNIQDTAGNTLTTPKQDFRVDDLAHKWQKLTNNRLALYWYDGGDGFGKALFDRANQAIDYLQSDTGVTVDQQVQILIYASHDDLMKALSVGANEWTGGQDFPEFGVVVIGVEPSDLEWGLGATTHELTHQVIHQKIRGTFGDLSMPHWMDEGLAVYYQDPGKPNAQFQGSVKRAIQNDTLVSVRSLASSFPADSAAANLAYGESWSVVDFIIRHYGKPKLAEILQEFKQGGHYDDVFMKVLGVDTDGLENEWRKDVGAKPRTVATRSNSQPTAFPTFGLSTDPFSSSSSSASSSSRSTGSATATSAPVAVNATPIPAGTAVPPSSTNTTPANPLSGLCGGVFGFVFLGVLGLTWQYRKRTQV